MLRNLQAKCPKMHLETVYRGRLDNEPVRWGFEHFTLYAKLITRKASVFHATSQLLATQASQLRKSPLITTVHDFRTFPGSETAYGFKAESFGDSYQRRLTRSGAKCDRIIAPFEAVKRDIIRILRYDAKKVDVVNYGVDHSRFYPSKGVKIRFGFASLVICRCQKVLTL